MWLLVVLVLELAAAGPASMIGFDFARSFTRPHRLGTATGVVNVGGFVASLVTMLLVGVVLDLRGAAPGSYPLADFRVALAVQYLPWAVGLAGIRRTGRAVRARAAAEGAHRTLPAVPEPSRDRPGSPVRLRESLASVPAYVPGRQVAAPGGRPAYKISSNEIPYPPLPSVLDAVAGAASSLNRYPDMFATELVEAIAAHLGVDPERVVTGTGSVGVLSQIVQATCTEGDEVVYAWRSFESYPIVVGVSGARPVPVPLGPDGRHDLEAMADAVTAATRAVLVCTPNNPTGPAVHAAEMARFLGRVPADVLVVLDEAYVEFARDPDAIDSLDLAARHRNVVVLRTFSKAHGLAGLRVGYAVADPTVAGALRKVAVPFGVSAMAQAAAIASLGAQAEMRERVEALVGERTRVLAALRAQGWPVPDSQANFVWLPLGEDSTVFAQICADAGLSVRPFPGDGVRCTVAETAANDLLIEVCASFRHRSGGLPAPPAATAPPG